MRKNGLTDCRTKPHLFCLPGPGVLGDDGRTAETAMMLADAGVGCCVNADSHWLSMDAWWHPETLSDIRQGGAWLAEQRGMNPEGRFGIRPAGPRSLAVALAVEGAFEGFDALLCAGPGRRDGAPLEQVAAALYQHGYRALDVPKIVGVVRLLYEMAGIPIPPYAPIIGERIFHVGTGIHVDGLLKDTRTYEPWEPEWLGHRRSFVSGRLSGSAADKIRRGGTSCRFD